MTQHKATASALRIAELVSVFPGSGKQLEMDGMGKAGGVFPSVGMNRELDSQA